MHTISESTVKKVVLPFLKHYYKYRPRGPGSTEARLDMRAEGGIIADGYLTFQKQDNTPFLGTFEATSYESRDEVLFRVQKWLLFWDSLAVATLSVGFFCGYLYGLKLIELRPLGLTGAIGVVWLCGLSVFLLFHLLFRRMKRYRYIYAVEQFKRYFADDQWIAVAEDVFPHSNDVYLKELKEQCVRNGFGLIIVGLDERSHLVITPSRHDLFRGKRKQLTFLEASAWRRPLQQLNRGALSYLPAFLRKSGQKDALMRFQRSYHNQIILTGIALAMLGYVFYEEFKFPDVQRLDQEVFQERMAVVDQEYHPEPRGYELDSAFIWQFREGEKPKKKEVYKPVEQPWEEEPLPVDSTGTDGKIIIAGGEAVDIYDCSRFYNLDGVKYLLIYQIHREEAPAVAQLDTLRQNKLDANILWMGCFDRMMDYFVIYLGLIYNDAEEAQRRKAFFVPILTSNGLDTTHVTIRPIAEK